MGKPICCICNKSINTRRSHYTITQTWEDEYADYFARVAHDHCMKMAIELAQQKRQQLNQVATIQQQA